MRSKRTRLLDCGWVEAKNVESTGQWAIFPARNAKTTIVGGSVLTPY